MGRPKGLLPYGPPGAERPWILEQLARARAAGIARVVVVLGYDADGHVAVLPSEAWLTVVVNDAPERGQFSSLQVGLAAVTGAAFVLPIDVPAAGPSVWSALAAALSDAPAAVPTFEDRGGHPVLLGAALCERVRALDAQSEDARLDRILASAAPVRVPVPDAAILANVNTPADLGALKAR